MTYAALQVTTNYSFLRGASHVEELFAQAAAFGIPALGITDRGSLAGIVRAHQCAAETGVRLLVGCRVDPTDAPPVLLYPTDRAAYALLCQLLSAGKKRGGKGCCVLDWSDVAAAADGMLGVLLAEDPARATAETLGHFREAFGDGGYVALTARQLPDDAVRLQRLEALARAARIPTLATGDVLYHVPERRVLQDVLTCIREGCTIEEAGHRLDRSGDRHLLATEEMTRQYRHHPDALARTQEIAGRCRFSLSELRYQYPGEVVDPALTPQQTLEKLTWEGIAWRFPKGMSDKVRGQLRHELDLIEQLAYAPYFLTVHSIVQHARAKGILCQGRGSAANSAVCYVLGITEIDPVESGLLFERFVSAARNEPPDIDVDFEHERREEVIQWVYDTYGRHRAALCATVIRYRTRGAVRDVGKAMGLPEDVTGLLASQIWGWSEEGVAEAQAAELNLNLSDRRLLLTLELTRQLVGFPRHLSQHPGGFVLTEDRLADLVPIEPAAMQDRQVIEWDKDDIAALRFMKVDVLGLGMLGCMRRAFDLAAEHYGETWTLANIPQEDAATFAMIRKADTLGTFQIESRAQMSMLPRLKPATFYDLVIQVAIVRPGPIQGDMVHPYLRRRNGQEKPDIPSPELEAVLGKTLGVPLFQEQAMQIAIVCAGFSADDADRLRRSMATFKHTGGVQHFRERLIEGMVRNRYTRDFAERTVRQIEGFGSYGFPESHAASFAKIAYASSWVKCHYPDVFCAALLNAQPMGFYAPAQIVRDARAHGVEVRPVCVEASHWDCTLEPGGKRFAVRLGMRMVKGLGNAEAADIVLARGEGYGSMQALWRRAGVNQAALERLADADAFHAWGLDRREALWAVRGLDMAPLPLFAAPAREPAVALPALTEGAEVVEDYRATSLTLRRHPVSFLREGLRDRGTIPCGDLENPRLRGIVTVAGLVLVRQRPGSANGVVFVTLEDETGIANLVVWPPVFERHRRALMAASLLACTGRVQREGLVVHVVADRLADLTDLLREMGSIKVRSRDFH